LNHVSTQYLHFSHVVFFFPIQEINLLDRQIVWFNNESTDINLLQELSFMVLQQSHFKERRSQSLTVRRTRARFFSCIFESMIADENWIVTHSAGAAFSTSVPVVFSSDGKVYFAAIERTVKVVSVSTCLVRENKCRA
jgi:hypothetical protein